MNSFNSNWISNSEVDFELLQTGDIRMIQSKDIMINQLLGNYLDGMPSNIYIRIYEGEQYKIIPLMGKASNSNFAYAKSQANYSGSAEGLSYSVTLSLIDNMWFYDVSIKNTDKEKTIDLIYTQDLGLGARGHVQTNEAYNSQYIDHKSFETEQGYTVCSRQGQGQGQNGNNPFCQQGCLQGAVSFSVDGYPFYDLSYKFDNKIKALSEDKLDNRIYQYEFAHIALQTKKISVETSADFTFYGYFLLDHNEAVEKPIAIEEILNAHNKITIESMLSCQKLNYDIDISLTLCSENMDENEINAIYPVRKHEEFIEGKRLSFFKETGEHVVLMDKESVMERSHGSIIITGQNDYTREDLLSSTNYIYGVFNSHVVVGNTDINKYLTDCRNALNIMKISGQRLMLKKDGKYYLLTMPAVYEIGFNYSKWLYKINGDIIEIVTYTATDRAILSFFVHSQNNKIYDFILYSQVCNAPSEYQKPFRFERKDNSISVKHDPTTMSAEILPDLEYVKHIDRDFKLFDDSRFYSENIPMGEPMVVIELENVSCFAYDLEARVDGKPIPETGRTFEEEVVLYRNWLKSGIRNFELKIDSPDKNIVSNVERFNDISLWFSHNARIHYTSPHGLEQYGGAAWGTRDVCQGPFEYFMATQKFDVAKDILLKVYKHQIAEDGSWPQWFMFDQYHMVFSRESHGDVILWPLKAMAYYLLSTKDFSILKLEAPYLRRESSSFTNEKETIESHINKQLAYIKNNFIKGTNLSRYGDGDWDDTLQPANSELRNKMVSGWTVALTYQVFNELGLALKDFNNSLAYELKEMAERIKKEFHSLLMKDGIVSGFVVFDEDEKRYLLHPSDKETGLNYRLLPMTRSMIGGMFSNDEAIRHLELIKENLYHPDGVRLMNTTCPYNGGVKTYFNRAESAANFGREIGLQYVHAHIRFIEAMAKIGNADEAWLGVLKINPILKHTIVKNSAPCQANSYFSSSDGMFDNRYDAMSNFDKLRTGEVNVKTGWRIYSSGSGIYLNQLISNVLGLRTEGNNVVIDPVLPCELDGLTFKFAVHNKNIQIKYHVKKSNGIRILVDGNEIKGEHIFNEYRTGGLRFDGGCINENSQIDVFI